MAQEPVQEPEEAFARSVEEGERRLHRSWPALLSTGAMGGIDVGTGVLALLIVLHATGDDLLAALAFPIGFIAVTLAGSELFTENFLVPVMTLATRRATVLDVARLWGGTLATNLLGGWVFTALVMAGFGQFRHDAQALGAGFARAGIGWASFATAMIAGMIITLMTWMEHTSPSVGSRLVASYVAGFLLASGHLNHAIVGSLEMFAGLQRPGAPYGYLDWASTMSWAALGNMVGGIGLVTLLRLVQAGGAKRRELRSVKGRS